MSQRAKLWIAVAVAAALAGAAAWRLWLRQPYEDRVYRIGFQNDPPNMQVGADGRAAGLGPDIVREAARRRGIRLEWVYVPGASAEALRIGQLDLWPLMAVLDERRAFVHFSTPYFRNYLTLVVRGDSRYRKAADLHGARAGFYDLAINRARASVWLPGCVPVPNLGLKQGLADLREGRVDVLLADELKLVGELLTGADTTRMGLRLIPLERPPAALSVAGRHEAAPVVEALRDEIARMAADGSLERMVAGSGVTLRREINDMAALIQAQQAAAHATRALAGMALLAVAAALLAYLYRRQMRNAREADRARRTAEIRLQLVADSLTEMVLAFDMRHHLVYANPALERLTGYTPRELQQAGFIDWVHPEDRQRMAGRWQ